MTLDENLKKIWKRIRKPLKIAGFTLSTAALTALNALGQDNKAELEAILKRPDLNPAIGTMIIQGADTLINDTAYTSPKTYVLDSVTSKDDPEIGPKKITYGPNPVRNGFNDYESRSTILST